MFCILLPYFVLVWLRNVRVGANSPSWPTISSWQERCLTVDGDRVTDEGGRWWSCARKVLQDLLLAGLVYLFDSLDQLRGQQTGLFNFCSFYIAFTYRYDA